MRASRTTLAPDYFHTMKTKLTTIAALLALLPTVAQAHPGHGAEGFQSGLAHPLLGWDHVLAMLAVGLWAAQLGRRALWAVPAAFIGVMALGGALGMGGMAMPFAEQGVLLSVLVLGVLIAASVRLPLGASMGIVGAFALCHGFAHGAELPAGSSHAGYLLGFILATAALHGCGVLAGQSLKHSARLTWLRAAGAAICVSGAVLAAV